MANFSICHDAFTMKERIMTRRHIAAALMLVTSAAVTAQRGQPQPAAPVPVRNDTPRRGQEVLVLRNQQLAPGNHEEYYRSSRDGVWPWYERIGTRIVGQWMVIAPDGSKRAGEEDAYRLARYASFEHWRATRDAENASLGGNGPNREKNVQAGRDRAGVQTGSKGAYFLQGLMAPDAPFHMPGLGERYEIVDRNQRAQPGDEAIAVRNDVAQPGREIVEMRYQRITKGGFDRYSSLTRDNVWPWEEKLGARPIGQWQVIYPDAPSRTRESPDYDEVITLTRYASYAHWQAMRPDVAVFMGGNGPDFAAWSSASKAQASLIRETTTEFMQGYMYESPPIFMPGLAERYQLVR
jgi:hypothetical protein